MIRPYQDPEFIKSTQVVPFDLETDLEARQQDEREAIRRFQIREFEESIDIARGFLNGMIICLIGWAIAIAWLLI